MKPKTTFFEGIRELIAGSRTTVARGVDLVQVHTNFEIGWRIVEEERRGKNRCPTERHSQGAPGAGVPRAGRT